MNWRRGTCQIVYRIDFSWEKSFSKIVINKLKFGNFLKVFNIKCMLIVDNPLIIELLLLFSKRNLCIFHSIAELTQHCIFVIDYMFQIFYYLLHIHDLYSVLLLLLNHFQIYLTNLHNYLNSL